MKAAAAAAQGRQQQQLLQQAKYRGVQRQRNKLQQLQGLPISRLLPSIAVVINTKAAVEPLQGGAFLTFPFLSLQLPFLP